MGAIFGEKKLIPALLGASGITSNQAKTILYYAIATYFLPEELDKMPILMIRGPQGTGKSSLLEQIKYLVYEPKMIMVESAPTLRDSLGNTTTALLDEGDRISEKLLISRYSKGTSKIEHKVSRGGSYWITRKIDIFGATIIVRRQPFGDEATKSRSITIKTDFKKGEYQIRKIKIKQKKIDTILNMVEFNQSSTDRIRDNWQILQSIAEYLKDKDWLEYSEMEIEKDTRSLKGGQGFEPDQAVLMVLKELVKNNHSGNRVFLSTHRK